MENLVFNIRKYLKRDVRAYRMGLSLNEEEVHLLRRAAKKIGVPTATLTRAAALVGAAMLLEQTKGK